MEGSISVDDENNLKNLYVVLKTLSINQYKMPECDADVLITQEGENVSK